MIKLRKMIEIDTKFQTPLPICEYMVDLIPLGAIEIFEPTPEIGNIVDTLKNMDIELR